MAESAPFMYECHFYIDQKEYALRMLPFVPRVGEYFGLMRPVAFGGTGNPEFVHIAGVSHRYTEEYRPKYYEVNLICVWVDGDK